MGKKIPEILAGLQGRRANNRDARAFVRAAFAKEPFDLFRDEEIPAIYNQLEDPNDLYFLNGKLKKAIRTAKVLRVASWGLCLSSIGAGFFAINNVINPRWVQNDGDCKKMLGGAFLSIAIAKCAWLVAHKFEAPIKRAKNVQELSAGALAQITNQDAYRLPVMPT